MRCLVVVFLLVSSAGCLMAADVSESGFVGTVSVAPAIAGAPTEVVLAGDAIGDVSWTFDKESDGEVDHEGTGVPATFSVTYASPGNVTATVVVTDDRGPSTFQVRVVVAPAAEAFRFSMATTVISGPERATTGAAGCVGFQAGQNGQDCVWTALDGMDGRSYTTASDGPAAHIEFLAGCSADSDSLGSNTEGNGSGTVPTGSGCAVMWAYGSATATLTLEIA